LQVAQYLGCSSYFSFVLVSWETLLFLLYVCIFLFQPHLKNPIYIIFMYLTMVNTLPIIFGLIPDIMSSFGVKHFLGDAGCKVVLYLFRVTHGLSICTTSYLSAFQAITISPRNSKWAWLKSQLSICILPLYFFPGSWICCYMSSSLKM
jgi:vomeronasal1 receptor